MFTLDDLRDAHDLVRKTLRPTPAFAWPLLAARLGAEVVVKHENHQPTGAFKVRGGLTYCDALSGASRRSRASCPRRAAITARASPSPGGASASR